VRRLNLAAVLIEDLVVFDLCPVDGEGLGGLDADPVYGDAQIPVDVGLAATAAEELVFSHGRLPDYG
jgi:hypothetical protein